MAKSPRKAARSNSRNGQTYSATPRTAAPKRRGKKAAEAINTDTREGLVAEMMTVIEHAEEILPTVKDLYWAYPRGKLEKLREEVSKLSTRMWTLVRDDKPEVTASSVFMSALMTTPGTAPTLARPGMWLEWIDYVPVLVFWGGFIAPTSVSYRMADPAEKWITSTGFQSIQVHPDSGTDAPRDLIRDHLRTLTGAKDFTLHDVDPASRDRVTEQLMQHEWIRNALDAGPVDPIPLPPKLQAVQQMLFV